MFNAHKLLKTHTCYFAGKSKVNLHTIMRYLLFLFQESSRLTYMDDASQNKNYEKWTSSDSITYHIAFMVTNQLRVLTNKKESRVKCGNNNNRNPIEQIWELQLSRLHLVSSLYQLWKHRSMPQKFVKSHQN